MFILVLALLIFGPRKLPEIGRTLGRGLSEFRKASNDLKRSINAELIDEEVRKADPRKMVREAISATSGPKGRPASESPEIEEESGDLPETASEPPSRTVARGGTDSSASEDPEPAKE